MNAPPLWLVASFFSLLCPPTAHSTRGGSGCRNPPTSGSESWQGSAPTPLIAHWSRGSRINLFYASTLPNEEVLDCNYDLPLERDRHLLADSQSTNELALQIKLDSCKSLSVTVSALPTDHGCGRKRETERDKQSFLSTHTWRRVLKILTLQNVTHFSVSDQTERNILTLTSSFVICHAQTHRLDDGNPDQSGWLYLTICVSAQLVKRGKSLGSRKGSWHAFCESLFHKLGNSLIISFSWFRRKMQDCKFFSLFCSGFI